MMGSIIKTLLSEGLNPVPSIHVELFTYTCNYSSRDIQCLWPLHSPTLTGTYLHTCTHVHTNAYFFLKKKDKSIKKVKATLPLGKTFCGEDEGLERGLKAEYQGEKCKTKICR